MKSSQKVPTDGRQDTMDELTLVRDAFERLSQTSNVRVACNVPLLGRCVDMLYMKDEAVFSIEFKLRDWKRAIKQARDHKLAADYAYVCLPKRESVTHMLPAFRAHGIGLMFFADDGDWPFEVVEEAPRSEETWTVARNEVGELLKDRDGSWM